MVVSEEVLIHFNCEVCSKWWSIADAPIMDKDFWFCPWCGIKQIIGQFNCDEIPKVK